MKKRSTLFICIVLIAALLLPACEKQNVTDTPIDPADIVHIKYSLWGDDNRLVLTKASINLFMKQNPEIQVEIDYHAPEEYSEYLDECLSKGTEADVIQLDYEMLSKHKKGGDEFYNLYMCKDELDVSAISTSYLNYGILNWKLNAIPISADANVFVYNIHVLQSIKADIPSDFETMEAEAALLAKDGRYLLGLDYTQLVTFLFNYYEQKTNKVIQTREGLFTFRDNDIPTLLDDYNRFIDTNIILPPREYSKDVLSEGKVAGTFCLITELDEVKSLFLQDRGASVVGDFPTLPDTERFGYFSKPDYMLAIGKNTNNPHEATKLINFLINDRDNSVIQGTDKGIPVSTKAEMSLMEKGGLNTLSYQGKLYLDYYQSQMTIIPKELSEPKFAERVVVILERYRNGELSLDDAVSQLASIFKVKG